MRHSNTLHPLALLAAGPLAIVGCSSNTAPTPKDTAKAVKLGIPTEQVTTTADDAIIKLLSAGIGQKLTFDTNLTSPPSRFKDDKGNPDDIQASAKTSLCGLRVAAMSGSYQEQTSLPETNKKCAEDGKNPVKATAFPSNNERILAVSSGRVDAAITDTPVVQYAQTQNKGTFESLVFDGTRSHNNVGLSKGSPRTQAVAAALQKLMDEGTYQKVLDKRGIGNLALTVASTKQTPVEQ